jgi:hypothetical protein
VPRKDPEARRAYAQAYRAKNPEKMAAIKRKYRAVHSDVETASRAVYRETHREELRAKHREYNAANKEVINARRRDRYAADPAPTLARQAQYLLTHRDTRIAVQKRYRDTHPDETRASAVRWRQANPEKVRIKQARYVARKRALQDTFTVAEHDFMLAYWSHVCAVCGNQEGFAWTLAADHWIPVSNPESPGTVATNMLPLCHSTKTGAMGCNNSKSGKNGAIWLVERFGARKGARILKAIQTYFALVGA